MTYLFIRSFFMRKNRIEKIKLLSEENEIDVTSDMINSYKVNTKKRITKKGLEKYYNNLILIMQTRQFV
jgi:hypothetical protein